MTVGRTVSIVSVLALVALIAGSIQQRPGPGLHKDPVSLAGHVPATLYYQDPPTTPANARPGIDGPTPGTGSHAGVVIAHGFAGDRGTMEALSESLARAGYTVLSLDMSGHGLNRNPLNAGATVVEQLSGDIKAGVDFLQTTDGFAPAQIAVLGHSMGAMAALGYGSRDAGAGGLVMLAGSTKILGPVPPHNTLFLYAEHDLPGIDRAVTNSASSLARVDKIEEYRTYGDFATGTAVRLGQIPVVNHGGLVTSPVAFAEIVSWLDQVTGFPARDAPPVFVKNPLGAPLLWLSFFLVLPGLGLLLGRLAPEPPAAGAVARRRDLGLLPVAVLLPLPFLALGHPGVLMGLSLADANVTHFALAGVLLVAGLLVLGRLRLTAWRLPATVAVAVAGWLVVSALFGPVSAHFHRVGLTPEKTLLMLWSALCLTPLALATQWLLYRPVWWRGTLLRIAARIIVLACVGGGLALGLYGAAGTASIIAILVLIASLVIVEPVLAGFYGRSRNILVAAGFDALVMGWLFALLLPTTQ